MIVDRFQNRLESTHFEPIPSLRTTLYAIAKSYKVIVGFMRNFTSLAEIDLSKVVIHSWELHNYFVEIARKSLQKSYKYLIKNIVSFINVLISVLRFGLVSAFGYLALDRYQHQFLLSWIEDFNHFFISFIS
ncbi:hypothetical protein RIR_jg27069.t3 [Rhizophagus irregularis DAOM 181602=DAOM 197198]|nr:hypothetical protein RIR_jg27069.t3 [Rhizophagus irregularis DAOM 181602=DAOM 197198]